MRFLSHLLWFLVFNTVSFYGCCQDRESDDSIDQQTAEGIFLTFEDFKLNRAIPGRFIDTPLEPEDGDFYFQLFKQKRVDFKGSDTSFSAKTNDIWGYNDGKALYLNRKNFPKYPERKDRSDHLWAPAIEVGTISIIAYTKNFKPDMGLLMLGKFSSAKNKAALYFLDTRNGKTHFATLLDLAELIKDDKELYKRFKKSALKMYERLFLFTKEYNRRHPFKDNGNLSESDSASVLAKLEPEVVEKKKVLIKQAGPKSFYRVQFKNDTIVRKWARLAKAFRSNHDALLIGNDENMIVVMPSETYGICRIMPDKSELVGIASDSCWLFAIHAGAITLYSSYPEKGAPRITHIQLKGSNDIAYLNKENLREMIKDDREALLLLEENKLIKAAQSFNEKRRTGY